MMCESRSVMFDSLLPYGQDSPWNSPVQNTGVGGGSLLQRIFQPRDWTQVSRIAGRFFTRWAIREVQGKTKWCWVLHSSCVWLFDTPWTVVHQALLFMGFSRHKYWSGLLCSAPGIFPTQGSNPHLLCLLHWQAGSVNRVLPNSTNW